MVKNKEVENQGSCAGSELQSWRRRRLSTYLRPNFLPIGSGPTLTERKRAMGGLIDKALDAQAQNRKV